MTTVLVALVSSGAILLPENKGYGYLAGAIAVLSIILLACVKLPSGGSKKKKIHIHMRTPFNYFILLVFTLAISYLLCILVESTKLICVLQATCMTTAMVIGLTSFAVIHQRTMQLTSFAEYLYITGFIVTAQAILFYTFKSTSENGL